MIRRTGGGSIAQVTKADATVTPILVPIGDQFLQGELGMPADRHGFVLFAHGSGSSRHSPQAAGYGSLTLHVHPPVLT